MAKIHAIKKGEFVAHQADSGLQVERTGNGERDRRIAVASGCGLGAKPAEKVNEGSAGFNHVVERAYYRAQAIVSVGTNRCSNVTAADIECKHTTVTHG